MTVSFDTNLPKGIIPPYRRHASNELPGPLPGGGVWTGEFIDLEDYAAFAFLVITDAAPLGLVLEWSDDGINPTTASATIPSTANGLYTWLHVDNIFLGRYVRLAFLNGPTAQTFAVGLFLTTKGPYTGFFAPMYGLLPETTPALVTRSVMAGLFPDGSYGNVALGSLGQILARLTDAVDIAAMPPVTVANPTADPETGLAKEVTLAQIYTRLGDIFSAVDGLEVTAGNIEIASETINLQTDEVEALLRQLRDTLGTEVTLASVLAKLGAVEGTVGLDAATLAALETVNALVTGTVAVSNFPASMVVSNFPTSTEIANDVGNPVPVSGEVTVLPPSYNKTYLLGTGAAQQIATGPGVLHGLILSGAPTVAAYDATSGTTGQFLSVANAATGFLGPLDLEFSLGLRMVVQSTKPYTAIWRT